MPNKTKRKKNGASAPAQTERAKNKARQQAQHDAMELDIEDAKAEARENGDRWGDIKEEWIEQWLADNWSEEQEAEFEEQWAREHGVTQPKPTIEAESVADAPVQAPEDYNEIPEWLKAGEPDKAPVRERLDAAADHQQDADHHHQQNNIEPVDAAGSVIDAVMMPPTVRPSNLLNTAADIATAAPELIEYDAAVIKGKAIVARLDADWWALCEVLARTKPKYGKQTVKRFFADVGLPGGERRFNVYGAWRDIFASWAADTSAPEPKSAPFTVLKVLQSHPDRAELLKTEPTMAKERAVKIMKAYSKGTKATNWRRNRIEKPINEIEDVATRAKHLELKLIQEPGDYQLLLEIVRPRRTELAAALRAGGEALLRSAALVENLEDHITDTDRERGAAEDEAASRLGTYRAAAAEAAEALAHRAADGQADDATEQEEEATYADAAPQ